jgi:hypothetical protein
MEEYRSQVEEALARLAEAQAQTEAALQELARRCESLVCDIEEIAYIVLYDVLKHGLGWEVGVLERTWQQRYTPSVWLIEHARRYKRACRSWGFHCSSPMAALPEVLTQIDRPSTALICPPCRRSWLVVAPVALPLCRRDVFACPAGG